MKIPNHIFKIEFFVLSGSLPVLILGEPFLIKEEVKIDYKEASIRIAGFHLFFDEKILEWSKTPDQDLVDKAFVTCETKNKLIQEYSSHNPLLGTIPNSFMAIELPDKKPFNKRPYPIPISIIEPMKKEMNKLIKLGIIR